MCFDLAGRIVALANLADEIIAMIAVAASCEANLRKAGERGTRYGMRDARILCADAAEQSIVADVRARAHGDDQSKHD